MHKINFTSASEYVKNNPLYVGDVVVFIKQDVASQACPRVGVIESIREDSFGEKWLAIPYTDEGCSCYLNISESMYFEYMAKGKPFITHVLGRIALPEGDE